MAQRHGIDYMVIVSLTTVWVVVFVLHVVAAQTTGLAQPAFIVSQPEHPDAYPTITGFRPEQGGDTGALREGDRLISVGSVDLRGVGKIGIDALAIQQHQTQQNPTIEYERNGQRASTSLRLSAQAVPLMRVPVLLITVVIAVLVYVRAGGTPMARLFFVTFVGMCILQTPFHGVNVGATYASKTLFYSLNLFVPPLLLSWGLLFPPEAPRPPRLALRLVWLWVPLNALLRGSYLFGGPLPVAWATTLTPTMDGALVVGVLTGLTYNYRRVDRIGRRRIKWVLYGAYVGGLPFAVHTISVSWLGDTAWYSQGLWVPAVAACAIPIGILIATIRHNLFDIDRLISGTASYSILLGVLAGGASTVVPTASATAATLTGLDEDPFQVGLTAALFALLLPIHQWLRPTIDRLAFPERRAFESGIQRLLEALSGIQDPRQLFKRTGEGRN